MARYIHALLLAVLTHCEIVCTPYHCSYPMLPPGVCIDRGNDTYNLYPCGEDLPYCPTEFFGQRSACTKTPDPVAPLPYIGDNCSSSNPCIAGTCRSSICVGISLHGQCSFSSECESGLRCESRRCVPAIATGAWGCRSDEDCELGAGCNSLLGNWNGTCVPYFSVMDGGVVTSCQGNLSYLCDSGFCIPSSGLYIKSNCVRPPVSYSPFPIRCGSDIDCIGVSRPWDFQSECQCGFNEPGIAFCELFSGDPPALEVTKLYREFAKKMNGMKCNTARRWQDDCLRRADPSLFSKLQIKRLYRDWYPKLQMNDRCVRLIITNNYWGNVAIATAVAVILYLL